LFLPTPPAGRFWEYYYHHTKREGPVASWL
jgi:hypothetical protein